MKKVEKLSIFNQLDVKHINGNLGKFNDSYQIEIFVYYIFQAIKNNNDLHILSSLIADGIDLEEKSLIECKSGVEIIFINPAEKEKLFSGLFKSLKKLKIADQEMKIIFKTKDPDSNEFEINEYKHEDSIKFNVKKTFFHEEELKLINDIKEFDSNISYDAISFFYSHDLKIFAINFIIFIIKENIEKNKKNYFFQLLFMFLEKNKDVIKIEKIKEKIRHNEKMKLNHNLQNYKLNYCKKCLLKLEREINIEIPSNKEKLWKDIINKYFDFMNYRINSYKALKTNKAKKIEFMILEEYSNIVCKSIWKETHINIKKGINLEYIQRMFLKELIDDDI